ncbi:signal peptide peptidase SppA [Helicobacter monodelphidis]|nr:signal peptide peptidase SppA [Helicobacter sp. 15-1451]
MRTDIDKGANLAILELKGPILDANVWSESIQTLSKDSAIKGVLLVVDSPGGALSPSVELYEEIKRLNQKKPIVAYAEGVMASGSYYASLGVHSIYANKGALVGSIGVIFEGLDASELMAKIGIKPQVLKAGAYKEVGTFTRQWAAHEKEELDNLIQRQYQMFVQDVCQERKIPCKNYKDYAEGRIFDASSALSLGLIDSIGTKSDAKKALVRIAGIKEGEESWRGKSKNFDDYLSQVSHSLSQIFANIILRSVP